MPAVRRHYTGQSPDISDACHYPGHFAADEDIQGPG